MKASCMVTKYRQTLIKGSLILSLLLLNSWSVIPEQGVGTKNASGAMTPDSDQLNLYQSNTGSGMLFPALSILHQSDDTKQSDELPGKQIRFENLSVEHGLSQSSVSSILQDRNGWNGHI